MQFLRASTFVASLVVLGGLLSVYVPAWRGGAVPQGHPYSGLTLLCLALVNLVLTLAPRPPGKVWVQWIVTAPMLMLVLAGTVMWLRANA
ncbi:MAG: hypothetical protein V4850_07425 [Myxococcota bacterium]